MVGKVWDEYGGSGLGEEGLGLGWRALSGCKRLRKSLGAKNEYGWPNMDLKGFDWVWGAWDRCKGL